MLVLPLSLNLKTLPGGWLSGKSQAPSVFLTAFLP